MDERRIRIVSGLALLLAGIAIAPLGLRGLPAGLMGGGSALAFTAWRSPMDAHHGRRLSLLAGAGLLVLIASFLALKALPRHSSLRLVGTLVVLAGLVALVAVVIRLGRAWMSPAPRGPARGDGAGRHGPRH